MRKRATRRAAGALLMVLGGAAARPPAARAAQDIVTPVAPAPAMLESSVLGAVADGGVGTSIAGDTLMLELGGQWAGLRTVRDRRWLVQWDALVAGRGGYLANEHPYLFLIGVRETAWAEAGYRFQAQQRWSPYLGARLGNELDLMKHPGLGWSDLDTINNVDRVGGVVFGGLIRVAFGGSFLDDRRSLLVVGFIQEQLNAAETNTPAQAFTGLGLGARYDVARSLTASVEGAWGVAPTRRDSLRELTDRTARVAAAIGVRKVFCNGMWAGLSSFIERDSDHLVYFVTGNVYDTANPPRFGVALLYGFPLGRLK